MSTIAERLKSGVPLVAIGATLLWTAWSGESLLYLRAGMTLPLVIAAAVLIGLGVTAAIGVITPHHVPRSVWVMAIPLWFILIVRPGPVGLGGGLADDGAERWAARAAVVQLDPGKVPDPANAAQVFDVNHFDFMFGVYDLTAGYSFRMIGQLDLDDIGEERLVRFEIVCCAADAVSVSIPLDGNMAYEHGTWVEVVGTWNGDVNEPGLSASTMVEIAQPGNPYLTL